MLMLRKPCTLIAAALLATTGLAAQAGASTPATTNPDGGLDINYSFGSPYTGINYLVCGSVPGSDGCYGSGGFGPFGHVGAFMEGEPHLDTATNTVTRKVFVVDTAAGTGKSVQLDVYSIAIQVSAPYGSISQTTVATIPLPLVGGTSVKAYMAGNENALFIGTDKSTQAVEVNKAGYKVTQVGGFSPPAYVSSITANKYGYVTVAFGGVSSAVNGAYEFDSNGNPAGDGGGVNFLLGTVQGLSSYDIPINQSAPPADLSLHYRKNARTTTASSPPDANLYTSYGFDAAYKNVSVSVCGSVPGSDGCYGSGSMGPFSKVGAMIEDNGVVNATTNTVTRNIYVVDQGAKTNTGNVTLDIYKLTEVIDAPSASISLSKVSSVPLTQLTGGGAVKTVMAANASTLYIGNDQSGYVAIDKSNPTAATERFVPAAASANGVVGVTADDYGYVTVSFADDEFFTTVGESGGGIYYLGNSRQALLSSDVSTQAQSPKDMAKMVHVNYHK